jgi:maltooligosyltrehalose trehalohydrolase
VFLDAVYNHLGPEGNYLWDYGSYFTNRYTTPWGPSLNFDGPYSDAVRRYFIDNAIYWMEHFHIDGLRLDATHALYDFSAIPFLEELAASVSDWADRNNRRVLLVAENDACDRRLVMPREANGYGMNGQWLDDLHHTLHCALTGEYDGYYADFERFELLAKVLREGFAYTGQYSPSRKRKQGTSARDLPADRFVVCTQNHDQVGNRMLGERLTQLTDFDGLKLAAGLVCLSPYVPLLFMGEEYGETAPFLYFISHGDQALVDAVRRGREDEFAAFKWRGEPPDPQAESTFTRSKLDHDLRFHGYHAILDRLYSTLLRLRRDLPALTNPNRDDTQLYADVVARIVCLERRADTGDEGVRLVMNFNLTEPQSLPLPADGALWQKICDSQAGEWRVDGESAATAPEVLSARQPTTVTLPPRTFVLYERINESRG